MIAKKWKSQLPPLDKVGSCSWQESLSGGRSPSSQTGGRQYMARLEENCLAFYVVQESEVTSDACFGRLPSEQLRAVQ